MDCVRDFLEKNGLPVTDDNVNVLNGALTNKIPAAMAKLEGCRDKCKQANFYCEIICQKWQSPAAPNDLFSSCSEGCGSSGALACRTGCAHADAAECKVDVASASPDFCTTANAEAQGDEKMSAKSACSIGARAAIMSGCKRGVKLVVPATIA